MCGPVGRWGEAMIREAVKVFQNNVSQMLTHNNGHLWILLKYRFQLRMSGVELELL